MRRVELFDEMARKNLENTALCLRNYQSIFSGQAVELYPNVIKWIFVTFIVMAFVPMSIVCVFMFLLIKQFVWEIFVTVNLVSFFMTFVGFCLIFPSFYRTCKDGWRIIKYEFNFYQGKQRLVYCTFEPSKKKHHIAFYSKAILPDMFPLPSQPTERDRELQQYIYQELTNRTGLTFANDVAQKSLSGSLKS